MNKNKNIRWGIIGCGAVTEVKSGPAYQKTDGFEVVAVMRRNAELVQDYAQRHGIKKYYTDAQALIDDDEVDAVYIATPPDSHMEYALKVAKANKIACIEKPLAPSLSDSEAIVAAFEAAELPLFVAYYRRSLPRFQQVKQCIDNGDIGSVRHVSWQFHSPTSALDESKEYNWRTDKQVALGGYFDDLASHGLDLFAYLFGNYEKVSGVGVNQQAFYSAFDAVSACWHHKNGITGTGYWNFGAFKHKDEVVVLGSLGEIRFSIFEEQPICIYTGDQTQSFNIENPENIQRYHVENMRQQLSSGEPTHPSTGQTALHTSWVMEQILQAD